MAAGGGSRWIARRVVVGDSRRTEDEGVSDTRRRLRALGRVFDVVGTSFPFETPVNSAAMQYYTQMPASDDSPSERDFGLTQRDPAEIRSTPWRVCDASAGSDQAIALLSPIGGQQNHPAIQPAA